MLYDLLKLLINLQFNTFSTHKLNCLENKKQKFPRL